MKPEEIDAIVEVWKDIPGYEGLYQISSLGQVKCLERIYYCGDKHSKRIQEEIILKPTSVKGYVRLSLSNNGKRSSFLIHRLVAESFIPIPDSLKHLVGTRRLQVNHKDENLLNNTVDNLEWCTASYNVNYGKRNEKAASKNKNGKKSKAVICLETGEIFPSQAEIRRQFGFCQSDISSCCKRRGTSHGYSWRFYSLKYESK